MEEPEETSSYETTLEWLEQELSPDQWTDVGSYACEVCYEEGPAPISAYEKPFM